MIILYVTACFMFEPQRCKEVSFLYDGHDTTRCHMDAVQALPALMERHPYFVVKSWRCGPPEAAL